MEKKTETTSEYLEITAAQGDGGKHKVAGLAYGGGKMRLFGWSKPVVVDLSGMTVPESVPLLANHENHTLGRVGVVNAKAENGRLAIEGDIVAGGELADAIVAQGKAGADWQLSIGAEVEAAELVLEDVGYLILALFLPLIGGGGEVLAHILLALFGGLQLDLLLGLFTAEEGQRHHRC